MNFFRHCEGSVLLPEAIVLHHEGDCFAPRRLRLGARNDEIVFYETNPTTKFNKRQ